MQITFENSIKSVGYMGAGIIFLGALLDAIGNSRSLITWQIAIGLSVCILLLWLFITLWIRYKKPVWGKLKITKPNRQINLFLIGMLILTWIPTFIPSKKEESPSKKEESKLADKPLWASKKDSLTFSWHLSEEYRPVLDSNIFIGVYYEHLIIGGSNRKSISISGRVMDGRNLDIEQSIKEKCLMVKRFGDYMIEIYYKGFFFSIKKNDNYGTVWYEGHGSLGITSSDIIISPIKEPSMDLIEFDLFPLSND